MTAISAATRVVAVIGDPVRHSLSPALHNAAFNAENLDWQMVAFEVGSGRGADAVIAMGVLGLAGMAVTMPHKESVAVAVDELDPSSAALRSVNTVVRRADGTTYGTSTDGAGFIRSLTARGIDLGGRRVAVLGAGAAARSIVDSLWRYGVGDIAIINRTESTAASAAALAPCARVATLADIESAEVLVNTTPVGMGSEDLAVEAKYLRPDLVVADIVYHPLETALLRAARQIGAVTVDGLGMLVEQARLQQELWTGILPDARVMRAAATIQGAAVRASVSCS